MAAKKKDSNGTEFDKVEIDAEAVRKIIEKLEIRRDAACDELEEIETAISHLEKAISSMENL